MKISFRGDYALKLLLELSSVYAASASGLQQTGQIARKLDIPKKFLEQIVLTLKGAHYLTTIRGPRGGIRLARPPAKITIGEIVRLIDGPTSPIACVSCTAHQQCDFEDRCVFLPLWREVRERINEVVDRTTFADLAERAAARENTLANNYSI